MDATIVKHLTVPIFDTEQLPTERLEQTYIVEEDDVEVGEDMEAALVLIIRQFGSTHDLIHDVPPANFLPAGGNLLDNS